MWDRKRISKVDRPCIRLLELSSLSLSMLFYFSISISVACLLLYYLATRVVGATIALIISSHYVQARGDYRMLLRHYGHHLGEVSQIYASLGKPPGVGGQQRSPLFEVQAVKILMAQI